MSVTYSRLANDTEPGTHYLEGAIFKGRNAKTHPKYCLWIEELHPLENGFAAEVVGGCRTGLELHGIGAWVSLTQAPGCPPVLRSIETG